MSTPNLASVLDVRRGVRVRGDVEQTVDSLHGTVTCEHSTTVITRSCMTGLTYQSCVTEVGSATDQSVTVNSQENDSQSSDVSTTSAEFQGVPTSSCGIFSRGFMTAVNRKVGLASILDHTPSCLTSCRERQPYVIHAGWSSRRSDDVQHQKIVEENLLQGFQSAIDPPSRFASVPGPNHTSSGSPQSGEVRQEFCPTQWTSLSEGIATSALDQRSGPDLLVLNADPCSKNVLSLPSHVRPSNDLQTKDNFTHCHAISVAGPSDAESTLQRPSGVLEAEDDLDLVCDTSVTSSFNHQSSPLCCSWCRPLTQPHGISSTPASTAKSATFLPHTGSSLYDELRPYLSDESEDVYSSGITTDDEY